ncbi:hypothetical protein G5I_06165 [Acromyrmex echinatior]|uniref:Uncharacterized protein n=1 Tax=Acromyrmex echinatior TaxID=103372 RepID=F4WKG8_ACREC|nr:hypothetical protein G5I_06165 [Acromyrmex echinatior]
MTTDAVTLRFFYAIYAPSAVVRLLGSVRTRPRYDHNGAMTREGAIASTGTGGCPTRKSRVRQGRVEGSVYAELENYFIKMTDHPYSWNASALSCTHHAVSIQLPISIPRCDKFMLLTDPSANSNSDTDTGWRHRPKRLAKVTGTLYVKDICNYLPVITGCCTSRLLGQISPANFSLVPCDVTKPLKILRMPAQYAFSTPYNIKLAMYFKTALKSEPTISKNWKKINSKLIQHRSSLTSQSIVFILKKINKKYALIDTSMTVHTAITELMDVFQSKKHR